MYDLVHSFFVFFNRRIKMQGIAKVAISGIRYGVCRQSREWTRVRRKGNSTGSFWQDVGKIYSSFDAGHKYGEMAGMVPQGYTLYCKFSPCGDTTLVLGVYKCLHHLKAQLQDKNIAISELKKLIEEMKGQNVDTNFEKQSILGKPPLQPTRNQPVVRQPTVYKFERSQVPRHRIASQVGVSDDLTKPVTPDS
ncbi:hypothetical protein Tco_0877830 [Tanacetum coccineum]|uniref:Uncharacterized protein n=1 Tax=Tanacetum coccineum TaxID=301880 RepID=A0ABQ5C1G8_9ASTR